MGPFAFGGTMCEILVHIYEDRRKPSGVVAEIEMIRQTQKLYRRDMKYMGGGSARGLASPCI